MQKFANPVAKVNAEVIGLDVHQAVTPAAAGRTGGEGYPRPVPEPSPTPTPPAGGARPRGPEDRRRAPTPMLSRYLLFGRRRGGRRAGETERIYVDRPGPWVIGGFVALTLFSAGDAWFTLDALARGGQEANPVMRAALSLGNVGFVLVKTGVTVVCGAFLALHKTWPLGRLCLWLALVGYAALTLWHLYGQFFVLPPH
jgi:hypothetical protein